MGDWGWSHLHGADKRAILQGLLDGGVHGGPFHVEIQPSDRCDIDCFFCSTRRHRHNAELPIDVVQGIVKQLRSIGAHSVTFCGGGEPLVHSDIVRLLEILAEAGIVVDHLTTSGTRLDARCTKALLDTRPGNVIVSLNAADATSYARLARRPEATFHRVVENLQRLISTRRNDRQPAVDVQFMIYKESYRAIPRMYELACSLGINQILFREPTFLPPRMAMSQNETREMLVLLEEVLRVDQGRRIGSIESFDRDLSGPLSDIGTRLHDERSHQSWLRRLVDAPPSSLRTRLHHHRRARLKARALALIRPSDGCIVPWHSLVIRADGTVPLCCILQTRIMGRVPDDSLSTIWHGEAFARVRRQMRRTIRDGKAWRSTDDDDIVSMCAWHSETSRLCVFRNFFYCMDLPFVRKLHETTDRIRRESLFAPETGHGTGIQRS